MNSHVIHVKVGLDEVALRLFMNEGEGREAIKDAVAKWLESIGGSRQHLEFSMDLKPGEEEKHLADMLCREAFDTVEERNSNALDSGSSPVL